MNLILLRPTDVLFFRDGRPMSGSLSGHTAAWPLPDVTNHALHAALHRAELEEVHGHDHHKSDGRRVTDTRKFGSVLTAGPFPVRVGQTSGLTVSGASGSASAVPELAWFFPRPKDAQQNRSVLVTLRPVRSLTKVQDDPWLGSSLPNPLEYAVANLHSPSKESGGEPWISTAAFASYLEQDGEKYNPIDQAEHFLRDDFIAEQEAHLGIGIDPETQTTGRGAAAGQIYTAHYLRLREGFRLGVLAQAMDKVNGDPKERRDLIRLLLDGRPTQLLVGGQQRVCTAERLDPAAALPLPRGLSRDAQFHKLPHGKFAVKWVLLSPAVWPQISAGTSEDGTEIRFHPGGWLPNWVYLHWDAERREAKPDDRNGQVLLTSGPGVRKSERVGGTPGGEIAARLVAAIVPKPIVVTGWALPNEHGRTEGGAKSTHLAVPAGAVYYFEADRPEDAVALARALNWHGDSPGTHIKNRRSTLMGEKGFGLGVCGTWRFYGQ